MTLSKNLKDARKSAKLTQKQVAERLEVDNTTVSKWESGVYEPDAENLKKLADLYSKTVDELLGRAIYAKEGQEKYHADVFFKNYESLSDEDKQKALEYIEYLHHLAQAHNEKENNKDKK